MKRIITVIVMAIAIALNVSAQSDKNALSIKYADGTATNTVKIDDNTKLTFDDETMNVITTDGTISIAYDNIASMNFTHYEYSTGDVNGDGSVDIADVNAVISIICGSATSVSSSADVNGDGVVDIADVNSVIGIICKN